MRVHRQVSGEGESGGYKARCQGKVRVEGAGGGKGEGKAAILTSTS